MLSFLDKLCYLQAELVRHPVKSISFTDKSKGLMLGTTFGKKETKGDFNFNERLEKSIKLVVSNWK